MKASVGIITRTKDRPLLLKRAIKSVLKQSFDDWVHVIINDGGDPKEVDALVKAHAKEYKKRVQVIHNKKSLGMEAASNKAIGASSSTYLVIHDDDDAWHKDFLKKMVAALKQPVTPNVGGVICHSEKVIEKMTAKSVKEISRSEFNTSVSEVTLWRMCGGNLFPPISFLFRRDLFEKVGGAYDADLPVFGDWEFNLRFLQESDIAVLPEMLAYYHHRAPSKKKDIYANSIIGTANTHDSYYAHLRNKFLRDDLKSGKTGIGHLVNMSFDLRHSSEKQDRYKIEAIRAIDAGKILTQKNHHISQKRANEIEAKFHTQLGEQQSLIMQLYTLFKPFIWIGVKLGLIKP